MLSYRIAARLARVVVVALLIATFATPGQSVAAAPSSTPSPSPLPTGSVPTAFPIQSPSGGCLRHTRREERAFRIAAPAGFESACGFAAAGEQERPIRQEQSRSQRGSLSASQAGSDSREAVAG